MITLVLGGTRSGKSEVAEWLAQRAAGRAPVAYLATGVATDADMAARIAAHQERRSHGPGQWSTVELDDPADLAKVLGEQPGPVLVDSLGTWVARFPGLDPEVDELRSALRARSRRRAATVVVSEEVGLGVHPPTPAGRRFADVLGDLNRAVADDAHRVLLVVAGRILPLER